MTPTLFNSQSDIIRFQHRHYLIPHRHYLISFLALATLFNSEIRIPALFDFRIIFAQMKIRIILKINTFVKINYEV